MADFANDNEQSNDDEDYEYASATDDDDYAYESDEEKIPSLERAYSDTTFVVPEGSCQFVDYKGKENMSNTNNF